MTETEILHELEQGKVQLPPLQIDVFPNRTTASRILPDRVAQLHWGARDYWFIILCKPLATPKLFQSAVRELSVRRTPGQHPMLVVPYLSPEQLSELESEGISGIDLSGNGIVTVPGELLVFRTGSPNKYPSSAPIKNVYRKNSALVARAFLTKTSYNSVADVLRYAASRGAGINLSTVSKVLATLEDDVIIVREKEHIRLVQPEKLLDTLDANFEEPKIRRSLVGKIPGSLEEVRAKLEQQAQRHTLNLTETGVGSTPLYAVMGESDRVSVYCTDQFRLLAGVEAVEGARFPNVEIIETTEASAYFDTRWKRGFNWSSPVQTYLELMAGEKRFRQTAEQVREVILKEAKG